MKFQSILGQCNEVCVPVMYIDISYLRTTIISDCILSDNYEQCRDAADWLLSRTKVRPTVAIVCGSGLGGLAEILKDPETFSYTDIPNFPQSTGVC